MLTLKVFDNFLKLYAYYIKIIHVHILHLLTSQGVSCIISFQYFVYNNYEVVQSVILLVKLGDRQYPTNRPSNGK